MAPSSGEIHPLQINFNPFPRGNLVDSGHRARSLGSPNQMPTKTKYGLINRRRNAPVVVIIASAIPAVVIIAAAVLALVLARSGNEGDTIELDHGVYRLRYDCGHRTAVRFSYSLKVDMGDAARPRWFLYDPDIGRDCQQFTTRSYAKINPDYDRGHLVPANHMDESDESILKANYMTNIVPQVR
jgi:hypothetical protein